MSSFSTPSKIDDNYGTSHINIYAANVRSLGSRNKVSSRNTPSYDYDIFALTETWLTKEITSSEFFKSSLFNVYRRDRDQTDSSSVCGGGVLIAVKSHIASSEIPIAEKSIECVCVKLNINKNTNVYVVNSYVPPNSSKEIYQSHLNAIQSIHSTCRPSDIIILYGDFNIPHATWISDNDSNVLLPEHVSPIHAAEFIGSINELGLCQVNNIFNSMDRLLDLVFTNDYDNFSIAKAPPLFNFEVIHPPILLTFEWHFDINNNQPEVETFNFKRGDYNGLNQYLSSLNLEQRMNQLSLDDKVALLVNSLNEAMERFIPKSIIKRNSNCPWSSKQLKKLKNKRNKEWKYFKATGDRRSFDEAFAAFDSLNTKLYDEYIANMASSVKSNPKSFWRLVNSRRKTENVAKILHYGDTTTTDIQLQADLFAEFFNTNFESAQSSRLDVESRVYIEGSSELFTLDEAFVLEELSKIDVTKGTGPDGFHPLLLKNCAHHLYTPLCIIFNESLLLGLFPDQWKSYSVNPIFKKGLKSNIENYRCIAKLPTIAKFFEKLVNMKLTEIVSDKITQQQHGFLKKRSTTTNLLDFTHFAFKNRRQVDVLYTDFAKAFDKVNHEILIAKLNNYNLPSNLIHWLKSYLRDRRQYVNFNGKNSKEFIVNSGVPQGSHLGPTLFLLFINDIVEKLGADVFISLFADDLKIAAAIDSLYDVLKLQNAIDKLRDWCT